MTSHVCNFTVATFMFIVGVEMEDALNEVLVEHARVSLLQQVDQTELAWCDVTQQHHSQYAPTPNWT